MAAEEGETLESLLNKATSPLNRDEDWDFVMAFCDQINKELEGPQIAVRLLAHKLQSPQEKESLYALVVLEACVKNCGKRFHQEIGKFRFLNELIKVVSPKYLGGHMTEKVKTKVVELMYSWSKGLKHEGKIVEAYQMLKRQGIVKDDPSYVDQTLEPPPLNKPRNAVFEDEEKSKLLARLLKSKHPEDLQAANRLIKNMVKQDSDRMDKVSKRVQELETVNNNMKVLREMMENYQRGESNQSERDVMKELYDNLEKSRPNLFRLASDTDDKDSEGINEILQSNDAVLSLMVQYKKMIEQSGDENCLLLPGTEADSTRADQGNLSSLLDLDLCGGLSQPACSAPLGAAQTFLPPPPYSSISSEPQPDSLLLDDGLTALGVGATATGGGGDAATGAASSDLDQLGDIFSSAAAGAAATQQSSNQNLLDSLGSSPLQTTPATGQPLANFSNLSQPSISQQTFPTQPLGGATTSSLTRPPLAPQPAFGTTTTSVLGGAFSTPPVLGTAATTTQGGFAGTQNAFRVLQPGGAAPTGGQNAPVGLAKPLVPQAQTTTPQGAPPPSQQQPVISVFSQQALGNSVLGNKTTTSTGGGPSQVAAPAMAEIDKLGESLMKQSLANTTTPSQTNSVKGQKPTATVASQPTPPATGPTPPVSATSSPQRHPSAPGTPSKGAVEVLSLTDLFVTLESIQPGSLSPVTAYEKNGLKLVMHFGKDRPRPDVQVMVVSVMSTNSSPVKNFSFQAAVPKVMKVKLQPPSATDLPAYNPILPPTAITQVMLMANPLKENIRLKFKVSYTIDNNNVADVGEVDNFPVQ